MCRETMSRYYCIVFRHHFHFRNKLSCLLRAILIVNCSRTKGFAAGKKKKSSLWLLKQLRKFMTHRFGEDTPNLYIHA